VQANKPEKRNIIISSLLLLVILLSFNLLPATALTPAGTVIENIATVAYDGGSLDSNIARLTITQLYGITLTPGAASLSGLPEQTLYFPMTLINTGNFSDNFQLGTASQQGWSIRLLQDANRDGVHQDSEQTAVSATGNLAPEGQYCYFAVLTIPAGAAADLQDNLTLSARCSTNSAWRTEVSYTAGVQAIAGVTLQPIQTLLTALPSEELYLSFTLTNSGNRPDTFSLTTDSLQGWPIEMVADANQDGIHQSSETGLLDPSVALAAGAHLHGFLHTQAPAEFAAGNSGVLRLQAVSTSGTAVSASGEYTIGFKVIPPGDITGDGAVGPDDASAIAQIALNTGDWTTEQITRADVNGDGVVNVLDVTLLLNLTGTGYSSLPEESLARQIALPITTASPGADKTLGLAIDQGAGVVGFQATILLDNNILTVSQVLPGSLMANPQDWEILSSINPGELTVLAYDTSGVGLTSGAGNLLSLQGAMSADALIGDTVVLAWAEPIVSNAQGTAFAPLTAGDGAVTVSEAVGSLQGQVTTLSRRRSIAIAGGQVEVWEGDQMLTSTVSDAAGNWQIADLAEGSYQVRVSATGYYTEYTDNVAVTDGGVTVVNYSLTAVKRSQTGGLKGMVKSQTGSPVGKAHLRFYRNGRKIAGTSTNVSGHYLKVPLAPASYTMVVTVKDCPPVESQVEIRDNQIIQADFIL
jgi:hypothetical protein